MSVAFLIVRVKVDFPFVCIVSNTAQQHLRIF